LEIVIRFPVDRLHQADEIDERVTRELLRALDREPIPMVPGYGI